MIADNRSTTKIITIFIGFIFLIDVNSIIQPTYKDYLEFNYLNCTNQTHNNTKTASLFHGVNLYNHTSFDYINSEPNLCRGIVDVLLYVQTSLDNFSRRNLIRRTFGSLQSIYGKRMVLLFVVGVRPKEKHIQKKLEAESLGYRDIVQANFYDSYRNLTMKHLVMLDWVGNYCSHASFITKTDDDVFVNPFALIGSLYHGHFNHSDPFILGNINYEAVPMRYRTKWRVREEDYPKSLGLYPPYMKGFAYILSQAAIKPLWFCSYFRPYLFIDDLFITGLVTKSMDYHVKLYSLDRRPYRSITYMKNFVSTNDISNYIFVMNSNINTPLWKLAWLNSLRNSLCA